MTHCGEIELTYSPRLLSAIHIVLVRISSIFVASSNMKVYSIALLSINSATPGTSTLLCQVSDLSSFSFYQRGSVGEFMGFFTKVSVCKRTRVELRIVFSNGG
jgi:hypothetical protein